MKTAITLQSQPRSHRKATAHKQRGNGLLYALLGSALLAIGGYYAFSIYEDKALNAAITSDITSVQDVISSTQRLFGQNNDYAAQTTATLVQSGAIPQRLRVTGSNTANNAFSQPITGAPANGTATADLMAFTWPVPRAACTEFVTAIANFSRRVDVGATQIKPLDGAVSGAAAAGACDASATPVVTFYAGRFAAVSR